MGVSAFVRLFIYIGEKDAGDLLGTPVRAWYPVLVSTRPHYKPQNKNFFQCEWGGRVWCGRGWVCITMYIYNAYVSPLYPLRALVFQQLQAIV